MKYNDFITTITEITTNTNIQKKGLTLVYNLDAREFDELNMSVKQVVSHIEDELVNENEFEISVDGLLVKIYKSI